MRVFGLSWGNEGAMCGYMFLCGIYRGEGGYIDGEHVWFWV